MKSYFRLFEYLSCQWQCILNQSNFKNEIDDELICAKSMQKGIRVSSVV